ncbi:hypothetical protein Tco_0937729 [Tanacetum coccineum]|uniref:Reverse transcriptase domain-containing protein n=1 Tax=Tanacetum coccineum TaxID=301880 RepID=A0ABQ5DFU5_9ASTR
MAPKRTTRSTPVTPAPTATTTTVTEAQLQALIDQGVAAAMAEAEARLALRESSDSLDGLRKWSLCLALAIVQHLVKSFMGYSQLAGVNSASRALGVAAAMAKAEASRVRNSYDGNGLGPRPAQAVRECSYSEFLKCKHFDFKGTEGVVRLTRWFEKMESVFSISNCTRHLSVKLHLHLQDDALTWWNALFKTTTPEVAHACHGNTEEK